MEAKEFTVKTEAEAIEPEQKRYRQFRGPMAILTKVLSAGLCFFILLYVSGILPRLGFYLIAYQFNAIFLTGILTLIFLLMPARKGQRQGSVPWYDVLFILAILVPSIYSIAKTYELSYAQLQADTLQTALGLVATVALLEAIRRTIGWPMVIILLLFFIDARYSYLLPEFAFSILEWKWSELMSATYLSFSGMFGMITGIGANIIYVFIAFGIFFMKVGGGQIFMRLALGLTGRMKGGPAKAAIVGSALFGTLSGSPAGNVAVTGSITIPLMKKTGYSPVFAGAVESIASTGGQIMPPIMGSTAFIMAGLLGMAYADVAIAAIVPALLYYIALFMQTHLRAGKTGLRSLSRDETPSIRGAIKEGWEFGIPFLVLVWFLFVLRYPPTLSGIYGIGALLVVSMLRKQNRLNLKGFIDGLDKTSRSMLLITPALAASSIIVQIVGLTGLGPMFASRLVGISGGNTILLFMFSAVASYVLGMGGALTLTYILLVVLVAPAIEMTGVPLLVSHFFVLYMGMSMFFTPPVCPVVFVAAGIADTKPYPIGWQSMRLGVVTYLVPFILIYNPALILMGEPLEIILAIITAVIGVFALSVGIERYLFTKTNWLQTILAVGAGLTMMAPGWTSDLIGIGLLVVVMLWQWSTRKSQPLTTTDK